MVKRLLIISLLCGLLGSFSATAQTILNVCPYSQAHKNQLACLIPDLTFTGGSELQAFNTIFAREIGELPVAVPVSGLALTLDKSTGLYTLSSDLGGVLTERGSTLGKHKLFLGFTYQHFDFDHVDGTNLKNIPTVSPLVLPGFAGGFIASTNSLHSVIDQYTAIAAFGLSDRIDISITVPVENVILKGYAKNIVEATNGGNQIYIPFGSSPPNNNQSISGAASGVGDVLLNGKYGFVEGERSQLAGGLEVRFASGNEYNLLGSGSYGFRPYIVYSYLGKRWHPHANFGYQWNSTTVLDLDPKTGGSLRLPDSFTYSAGVDYSLLKRLTLVGDLVGRHYDSAQTITTAQVATGVNVVGPLGPLGVPCTGGAGVPAGCNLLNNGKTQTVGLKERNDFDEDGLAVGFKWNPVSRLLVSANVLIKLNSAGLREGYVPLVGVSYRF